MQDTQKIKILDEIFGHSHSSGNEILYFCPVCNHHKRKLSINITKNAWHCWVCEYRGNNLSRLVKRHGNFLQREAWEAASGELDINASFEQIVDTLGGKSQQANETQKVKLPDEFISLCNKNLPLSAREPLEYLHNRGLTRADILKWKIGYCKKGEYAERVIVPSFDLDGDPNYFVARAYNRRAWPVYKNPPVGRDIIFNELYVDFRNDLVLVEGVFDAVKCTNAVPLLGSTMSEDSKLFNKIIKQDTTVWIALDPDAERKAMKLIKNLLLYGAEVYKIDVSGYKDVGEMTKREFFKRKQNAKPVTADNYIESAFSAFL